jgi:hypothetical protein
MGEYLNYRQLLRDPKHKELWERLAANKIGQLAQGVGTRISKEEATNTINFILKDKVPKDRMKDVICGSFSCDYKPNKEEKWRTQLTKGGDQINYPFDCRTSTADMIFFKIIINSTISTRGAKCMMINLSNFYLKTPMARRKFMRLKVMDIHKEIIKQYKLRDIVTPDKYVYCEISKGMYGLPQSGIIAQQLLKECLGKVGYTQSIIIPGLWKHQTRAMTFCLVVDNFAIKYTKKEDVDHLLNSFKKYYEVTEDWMGKKKPRTHHKMGLQQTKSPPLDAARHQEDIIMLQTRQAQNDTKLYTSTHNPRLQKQNPIRSR